MVSEALAPYEARFAELQQELEAFVADKARNERRWSLVSSGRVVIGPILGGATATLISLDAPTVVGVAGAVVTGFSSLVALLPDQKKRLGNKLLHAKAKNLFERVKDREDELNIQQTTPYLLLRAFRYERSALESSSSTSPALSSFGELPAHSSLPDSEGEPTS